MPGLGIVIPRAGGGGVPIQTYAIHTSDNFTGTDGSITNRVLNNALGGGASATWIGNSGGVFGIGSNRLYRLGGTTSASVVGFAMPQADYAVYAKILAIPTGTAPLRLMARRTVISGGTDHSITINGSGTATGNISFVVGDVLGIRVTGTLIEYIKNDVVYGTATASILTAGFAGIACATNSTFELDDFVVRIPS